jgi:hypothetical protein
MSPCARLQAIEKNLGEYPPDHVDDVIWMLGQIRSWQGFAKKVIDFGDALREGDASPAVHAHYEQIFSSNYGKAAPR